MTGLHESTLALSVYNALARHGDMTERQVLAALQRAWHPELETNEVRAGIEYLTRRKMVAASEGGKLGVAQLVGGTARTVLRNPGAQHELMWGSSR